MRSEVYFSYRRSSWISENIDHCITNLQRHQFARDTVRKQHDVFCYVNVQEEGLIGVIMRGEPSRLEAAVTTYAGLAGPPSRGPYDRMPPARAQRRTP